MSARIQVLVPRVERVVSGPLDTALELSSVVAATFRDDDEPPAGLSAFVGAHLSCFPTALNALRRTDAPEVHVTVTRPGSVRKAAATERVAAEFATDIPTEQIIAFIKAAYTALVKESPVLGNR